MTKAFIAWATHCSSSIPDDPGKGFIFDGRIAEDFKLATGTWVSVGPMRAQVSRAIARPICATSCSRATMARMWPR